MTPEELKLAQDGLAIAKSYVDLIVKPPLEQLGRILSDIVGSWRQRNQVRLILKTKAYLEANGINPTKLLPDIFVPLIEAAGNVEDETLSDMFANLLACHLDPEYQDKVHPSYAKVLEQMSPFDAVILNTIVDMNRDGESIPDRIMSAECAKAPRDQRDFLSFVNLERLGLLQSVQAGKDWSILPFGTPTPTSNTIVIKDEHFLPAAITLYGLEFCRAVMRFSTDDSAK